MARRGFGGALMRGVGARDHTLTVTGKESLAPHFVRVHLASETLFEDMADGATAWIRIWFPDPDGSETEHQRGYTLSTAQPDVGTFSVDFVLHEPAGPASAWAVQAEPGQSVQAMTMGSTPFTVPAEPPAGYLLIGDSASTPALNGIIETIPAEVPIELYLEQHEPDDVLIPLAYHPRLRVHRVPRTGPESLAVAIEPRDWSNWYAWCAPESASLKAVRSLLRDDFGFPKSEIHQQAYWIEGRAMGKRRGGEEAAERRAADARSQPLVQRPPEPRPSVQQMSEQHPQESGPVPAVEAAPGAPAADAPTAAAAPAAGTSAPSPTGTRGSWRANAGGRLLAPLRPAFIAAGVLQGLITLIQLAPFVLLVELARRLLGGAAREELWVLGIWAVVLLGAGVVLETALLLWLHTVDARFERELRTRLLSRLARLPLGWFAARDAGRVKKLVQDDTLSLHYLITHAVPDAVAAVVAPVAVLVYLFAVDWRLGLVLFGPVLVYIVAMWVMMLQSGPKIAESGRWSERMAAEAAAYLDAQPVVRIFGGSAASTFRGNLSRYIAFLNEWQRPFVGKKTVMDLATRPGTFLWLLVGVGTLLIVAETMAPVDLLPFLLLGTTFGARLLGIGYGLSGIQQGQVAARNLQNVLDEPTLTTSAGTPAPTTAPGQVEIDRVSFGYRPGVPVLQEVSLTLEPGTVTALVGASGSGKSTLASLVARFHDVDAGQIRVDGRDLRTLTDLELYTQVGFVFQDAQLVHGTVRENIALAVPEATEEQVIEAARVAQLHERITSLAHGYDTVLGAEVTLSGGEQQRLTIARALLADTPVLILDEATAFADPESEFQVQRALSRLAHGRTLLVIAHRLRTITDADAIVVLDGGRVVEQGTHHELVAGSGRYRRLWDAAETAPATPDGVPAQPAAPLSTGASR